LSREFDGFAVAAGFDRKPQIFDGRKVNEFKRFWPIAVSGNTNPEILMSPKLTNWNACRGQFQIRQGDVLRR
jgi:hypothetical protein